MPSTVGLKEKMPPGVSSLFLIFWQSGRGLYWLIHIYLLWQSQAVVGAGGPCQALEGTGVQWSGADTGALNTQSYQVA